MAERTSQLWHVLDARAIWVKELAHALSCQTPLTGWIPEISWTACLSNQRTTENHADPQLTLHHFPLQRGFAKWPIRILFREEERIIQHLRAVTKSETESVLLCASPHYAAVAELWKGPVVYYMSDLYYAWGEDPAYVNYYDRRMCQRADLVCPVSERGKEYLMERAQCPAENITISPMATRASNVLPEPLLQPMSLPADIADLPRPVIGIIGNLAKNTDWLFLQDAVRKLPDFSWVLVGSTEMPVPDQSHRQAREQLRQQGGRVRFLGPKPYSQLASYAQSFDLALLPYRKIEPTYSGSSTRFYEHLAACRPMFATDGFAELLTKEPLVRVIQNADDFVHRVLQLQKQQFQDGLEADRWKASQHETWEMRASQMRQALEQRLKTIS
ncbi:MAG: glycosyltransferase [Planctomycetia bacterium]|nr:glycosyltransferase [Planctomycetia bacterium]